MQVRQDIYGMAYGGYPAQESVGWGSVYGRGGWDGMGGPDYLAQPTRSILGRNIVNTALSVANGGWRFTGDALAQLSGPSESWDQISSDGMDYLQIKPGVRPSVAIMEPFEDPANFAFDCATSTALVLLKAQLDSMGSMVFDSLHSRAPMVLAGWVDTTGADFFMGRNARFVRAGEVTLNGLTSKHGELAPFDIFMGDLLTPGGVYYFEKPGDMTSYSQGWNAIYLGGSGNIHQFWRVEDGVHTVDLREQDNLLIDVGGMYQNEYLSSSVLVPMF